jgi:hypothetical protein
MTMCLFYQTQTKLYTPAACCSARAALRKLQLLSKSLCGGRKAMAEPGLLLARQTLCIHQESLRYTFTTRML